MSTAAPRPSRDSIFAPLFELQPSWVFSDSPGVGLAAMAALIGHMLVSGRYGFFRDEFYYLACGRHLAWGYVDHPPMIALLAAFVRLLGVSLPLLRFFPAAAHAVLILVAGRLARAMGGDGWAQTLAALAVLIGPVFLGAAGLFTMNPLEQLLWSVAVLILVGLIERERTSAWIAFGVVAGLGLLTKHSMAFFLGALPVALLLTPERRLLRGRGPWIAAAIALALAAPNLVWEIRHGWPTLEFMHNASAHKNRTGSPLEFLIAQALMMHPVSVPLFLAGLVWPFASPAGRRFRVFAWMWVMLLVLFLVTHGKDYYLAPVVPVVLAAGAVAISTAWSRGRARWFRPALATVMLLAGAVTAPLVMPILPPEQLVRWMARIGYHEVQSERHRPSRLPQYFADQFGWPEMVAEVARVYHGLTPDEQQRCVLFASNYGEAGAIDLLGPRLGLPPAAGRHNNYWLWGPPRPDADIVITIGESPDDVANSFSDVRVASRFSHPWNMPYESDLPIIVARHPRLSWREIWPQTKKFI